MVMRVKRPNHGVQQWWPVVAVPLLLGMVLGLMAFYWMLPFRAPSESGELLVSRRWLAGCGRCILLHRCTCWQWSHTKVLLLVAFRPHWRPYKRS